jgi:hypothetical protein
MNPIILCIRGFKFTSLLTRLLCTVRYGLNFRKSRSHVAILYPGWGIVSAEPKGVLLLPENYYEDKDVDIEGFELMFPKNECSQLKNRMKWMAKNHLGDGYAIPRYIIDAARIFCFVLGILSPIPYIFGGWIWLAGTWGLILAFFITWQILLRSDRITQDCSEMTAMQLLAVDWIYPVSGSARNEFPDSIYTQMRTLALFGATKRRLIKNRNGRIKLFQ